MVNLKRGLMFVGLSLELLKSLEREPALKKQRSEIMAMISQRCAARALRADGSAPCVSLSVSQHSGSPRQIRRLSKLCGASTPRKLSVFLRRIPRQEHPPPDQEHVSS